MADGQVLTEQQIAIGDPRRRYSFSFPLGKTDVAELFETPVPLLEGSTIEIEESVYIESFISERSLIDSDRRWQPPKDFIGSYRLTTSFEEFDSVQLGSEEGLITSETVLLQRTTPYIVVPPQRDKDYVLGIGRVNACSFELEEVIIPGSGATGSNDRRRYRPVDPVQMLLSSQNIEFYPVGKGLIRQAITGIGLYYNFGAQPIQLIYRMRIGGQVVSTRVEAEELLTCPGFGFSCDDKFQVFLDQSPDRYRTAIEAATALANEGLYADSIESALLLVGAVEETLAPDPNGNACIRTYYTYTIIF